MCLPAQFVLRVLGAWPLRTPQPCPCFSYISSYIQPWQPQVSPVAQLSCQACQFVFLAVVCHPFGFYVWRLWSLGGQARTCH